MNEHLFTNNDGLRLISTFEGAPRLKARLCEGGRYELGYGVTFHLDGSPVLANQTCTEDQATAMFRNALQRFEAAVLAHVTVPLNSNQFSALVAFAYNIGEANFATSTVLRMVNQLRFEDAAAAFGMWVFATRDNYKQALRGLLRRRYAEACLFLGYDWVDACDDEAVALQREKPATLPGADRVLYKTPFANILRAAQHYPLDAPQISTHAQSPVLVPTVLERIEVPSAVTPDTLPPDLASLDGIPVQLPIPDALEEDDELLLDTPAAPLTADANGTAQGPPPSSAPARVPQPNPGLVTGKADEPNTAAPRTSATAHPPVSSAPFGGPSGVVVEARPVPVAPPPIVRPPPPKLPDPPIPIGQQTSAVDATRKGDEWSQNCKSMVFSRRFWGLFLVLIGRLWMLKTGSNAVLGTVSDPLVMEMFSGFMVMILGELVQHWGERKATRPLK